MADAFGESEVEAGRTVLPDSSEQSSLRMCCMHFECQEDDHVSAGLSEIPLFVQVPVWIRLPVLRVVRGHDQARPIRLPSDE